MSVVVRHQSSATRAVFAQTRDISVHGELLDRIAAIVNDGLVLKSELDAQMTSVEKRLAEQKVELPSQNVLQQQVLDRLILQEIQLQRAKHVGLTITDVEHPERLEGIAVEEPTISVDFIVNNSPFAGKDGKFVTSRQVRERRLRATTSSYAAVSRSSTERRMGSARAAKAFP